MTYKQNKLYVFMYHGKRRIGRFIKMKSYLFHFTLDFQTLNGIRSFCEYDMMVCRKATLWERIKFWFGHGDCCD